MPVVLPLLFDVLFLRRRLLDGWNEVVVDVGLMGDGRVCSIELRLVDPRRYLGCMVPYNDDGKGEEEMRCKSCLLGLLLN